MYRIATRITTKLAGQLRWTQRSRYLIIIRPLRKLPFTLVSMLSLICSYRLIRRCASLLYFSPVSRMNRRTISSMMHVTLTKKPFRRSTLLFRKKNSRVRFIGWYAIIALIKRHITKLDGSWTANLLHYPYPNTDRNAPTRPRYW